MAHDDPTSWLLGGGVAGGGVLGALATVIAQAWRKPSSQAEVIEAATNAATAVIGNLRGEVDRLHGRVDDAEDHQAKCEQDLAHALAEQRALKRRIDILRAGRIAHTGEPPPDDEGG
jgi:hypothetical protein